MVFDTSEKIEKLVGNEKFTSFATSSLTKEKFSQDWTTSWKWNTCTMHNSFVFKNTTL